MGKLENINLDYGKIARAIKMEFGEEKIFLELFPKGYIPTNEEFVKKVLEVVLRII